MQPPTDLQDEEAWRAYRDSVLRLADRGLYVGAITQIVVIVVLGWTGRWEFITMPIAALGVLAQAKWITHLNKKGYLRGDR